MAHIFGDIALIVSAFVIVIGGLAGPIMIGMAFCQSGGR